ncbi:hypothetical protein C8J56DRAFT_185849 [Mycena floridula]|nr:hypothetical protein C8J56DRAFT_185849 [Mycena floridula]
MKTTIIIRNFVGKAAKVEVDLDSTIANLKPLIPSKIPPIVTYQGHELRDHRTLSYYGIQENAILHTVPPSKCPYVQLQFERPNRAQFTLQISSDTAVSQLMKDIAFEEKLPVHGLSFSSEIEDDEDSDTIVVSDPQILPPDALISEFPLENATIFVHGSPPPKVPPAMFDVRLTLYDDGRKLGVQARLQQTLEEFRLAVKDQHGVDIAQDVLILVGKELVGEDIPVWDLGFHPGCTVHAVPFFSFNVEIVGGRVFDTMLLHPLTRLSKIRELLRDQIPSSSSTGEKQFSLDDYWFTLTGRERLKDWRNLWDLSIISGSTLYMRESLHLEFLYSS